MATLLIVHHTPSPHLQAIFEAVLSGATDPEITGVDVVRRPALGATVPDVLEADGYLLGTPANIGYMSVRSSSILSSSVYGRPGLAEWSVAGGLSLR